MAVNWRSKSARLVKLSRQAAAHFNAQRQDIGSSFFGALLALGVVGVEHDERVQVPVASVEDVGDAQAVAGADLRDGGEHFRQAAQWNCAIHAVVIGDAA